MTASRGIFCLSRSLLERKSAICSEISLKIAEFCQNSSKFWVKATGNAIYSTFSGVFWLSQAPSDRNFLDLGPYCPVLDFAGVFEAFQSKEMCEMSRDLLCGMEKFDFSWLWAFVLSHLPRIHRKTGPAAVEKALGSLRLPVKVKKSKSCIVRSFTECFPLNFSLFGPCRIPPFCFLLSGTQNSLAQAHSPVTHISISLSPHIKQTEKFHGNRRKTKNISQISGAMRDVGRCGTWSVSVTRPKVRTDSRSPPLCSVFAQNFRNCSNRQRQNRCGLVSIDEWGIPLFN